MISPITLEELPRWSGHVPRGYHADFIGTITSDNYHAGKSNWADDRFDTSPLRRPDEYFEWHALIDSVRAAKHTFTMIEAGAGYGRWSVRAAVAVNRCRPDLRLRLIAVEPEPTHYQWLKEHFAFNNVPSSNVVTIRAAMNATGQPASFTVGHPKEWYGQAIVPPGTNFGPWPNARIETVPGVTLGSILRDVDYVDLLDMDIQGAEADCIDEAIEEIVNKVRRIYIATHSIGIHDRISHSLNIHGWSLLASYPPGRSADTEFGSIEFVDGVQYWLNPMRVEFMHKARKAIRGLISRLQRTRPQSA